MSQTYLNIGSAERINNSAGGITISAPIALKRRFNFEAAGSFAGH
jgi:hypothetical protein